MCRAPLIGLMLVLLISFSRMVSMVLFLRGVGNGYGIYRQNYVALLQGSEMSAGLHCRNLMLGIKVLGYHRLM